MNKCRSFVVAGVLVALVSTSAMAHQDPPACTGIDNAMRLVVTRNNGDPVVGVVSECETLKFQARLQWTGECLIQGGTFKVVTPDGVDHVVETPVRCLGDATVNAEGCSVGQDTEINSAIIDYTVSPGDAVGNQLTAMAVWEDGILHQAAGNVPGQGDERAIEVTMELCDDELFCNGLETCDPEATNGVQLGLCQPGTPPDCGASDQCAERGCDEENDECFEIDTSGRCGASDFCVERGCLPDTGCFETDNSELLCPDEFCTERECNPETSQCDETDVSDKCGASDQCAIRTCDEVNDECDEEDTSGRCGETDFCVERGCLPDTGCFETDNSELLCPDEFCTERECNPETSQCDETDVSDKCGAGDQCTTRTCDEVNDECDEEDTSGRCGASDSCVDRGCLPDTGCFENDNSDVQCPDEFCTERECNPAGGCIDTDVSGKCGSSDECTDRSCDEVNDECDEEDTSGRCGTTDFCVERDCDPETGCTEVDNSETLCPDDFCTERDCNPETSQCDVTDVSGKCNVDPNIPDVCEICDEENDECVVDLTVDPICNPNEIICRTPGFWSSHAGTEKNRSQNITQAVIELGGGCFEVCGEVISDTEVNSANSVLEAMCASPRGDQRIQLARQLTAMGLNCIVSEVGVDCGGDVALGELFADCNAACVGDPSDRSIGECIGDVDCFNNGGCRNDGNCHERPLPEEFQPPGPAGSPGACQDARKNSCTVIQPGESNCAVDTDVCED